MRQVLLAMLLTLPALILADVAAADDAPPALKEFKSEAGGFAVLLPETPQEAKQDDPNGQVQFTVARPSGALIVSYQDNPGFRGKSDDVLEKALNDAQETVRAGFQGKTLKSKPIKLAEKYPGLDFECDMPGPGGIYCSRSYLVDGRLYQVIAVGTKEYTSSAEAQQVLGSLKLLK